MNPVKSITAFVHALRSIVNERPRDRTLLNGQAILHKNAVVNIHPGGIIQVDDGVFEFNKPWTKNDPFPSLLDVSEGARLAVKSTLFVYSGSRVYVNKGASLVMGSDYINNNLNLTCFDRIEIGHNVAISVNVSIRDSANHTMMPPENVMT